jgi:hypothetical protein
MRTARIWTLGLVACSLFALGAYEVQAQPSGLNGGRDCQVVRSCNFGRGGIYRGCLSSYTCRTCRLVASSCFVDGSRRVCQRMRCTWGG